jgi:hypothetical protein
VDDDRPRDEVERAPDELRELEAFREFDALRAPEDAFVLLPLLLAPFLEVVFEPLDELRRRLVLAFACAIFSSSVESSPISRRPTGLSRLTRAIAGETAASFLALGR